MAIYKVRGGDMMDENKPSSIELESREVWIDGEINSTLSKKVIANLLSLARLSDDDITLYINTLGGSIYDGLAIYDVMNAIKPNIITIGVGRVANIVVLLLASGTPGKRYALRSCELILNQPYMEIAISQEADFSIKAEHLKASRERFEAILSANCKVDSSTIHNRIERESYIYSSEAEELGLIDHIWSRIRFNTPKREVAQYK